MLRFKSHDTNKQIILHTTYTVGAAPPALGSFLQLGFETHQVIRSGAGVTQYDLTTLLTHLAVVLVVRLVTIAVLSCARVHQYTAETASQTITQL